MRVREQVAHYAAVSPSEGVWAAEIQIFLDQRTHTLPHSSQPGGELFLDFYVRNRNWFIIIVSRRNDSVRAYQRIIGFYTDAFREPMLRFRHIQPAIVTISDDSLKRFVTLVERDSIWSLIGPDGFWLNDSVLADLFVNATKTVFPSGSIEWLTLQQRVRERSENEIRILNLDFLSTDDRASSIGELHLEDQGQGDITEIDSLISTQARVEYSLGLEDWYAVVISNRTDSAGEYRPIIGHRIGDSLEYRLAGTGDYRLEGERMQEYLGLVETDSLWKLISPEPLGDQESDWRNLYYSLGRTSLPDGSPRQTRYLDISLSTPTDSS